jgi:hypothetical protein
MDKNIPGAPQPSNSVYIDLSFMSDGYQQNIMKCKINKVMDNLDANTPILTALDTILKMTHYHDCIFLSSNL